MSTRSRAIGKQRGREGQARRGHVARGGPGPAARVIQLSGGPPVVALAARSPTASTRPSGSSVAVAPSIRVTMFPMALFEADRRP